ncbi:hypothetical protein [Cryptosporangium sp. NPDC051539]|uniref:hypothetical protein n=1 Tax=Cryptosporangium sp. NPDC051539 TaxID=3363962 RepID=UPI0037BCC702
MAVRLNESMVASAVDAEAFAAAEQLLSSAAVGEVSEAGGGATASVRAGRGRGVDVWVGVVDGCLSTECECDVERADSFAGREDLCIHAVAVALRALRGGFAWSSAAVPPSAAVLAPQVRELTEVAEKLSRRRLAVLVATFAAADPRLRTRLLVEAGELGPLTQADADQLRRSLSAIAAEAITGRWDMHDVVTAGEKLIGELETVAERPASIPAMLLAEYAAGLWDGLAAHLFDDWEHYDGVPEEMGERVRRVHLHLCEQLQPDPGELTERLDRIISKAEVTSCLDAPHEYVAVCG